MISQLTGILAQKNIEGIVVDVNGVGYEVLISRRTLESLPETGSTVKLNIYTHVNEAAFCLFGFLEPTEKILFKKLISVSGIGPRTALQVLSGLGGGELIRAILNEDLVQLTAINGIGRKTAERLIVELKDKLVGMQEGEGAVKSALPTEGEKQPIFYQVLSALVNLGYNRPVAERALTAISIRPESHFDEVLKGVLGVLAK